MEQTKGTWKMAFEDNSENAFQEAWRIDTFFMLSSVLITV